MSFRSVLRCRRFAKGTYERLRSHIFNGEYPERNLMYRVRVREMDSLASVLALHHLGFGYTTVAGAKKLVEQGARLGREYFFGDWWKEGDIENQKSLDNSRRVKRDLIWMSAFSCGLVCCALSRKWDIAADIADWLESNIPHDGSVDRPDGQQFLYHSIAAELRDRPMAGVEKSERKLVESNGAIQPLGEAWMAVRNGDEDAYQALIGSAIRVAAKAIGGQFPAEWVAFDHSLVVNVARHRGFALPELEAKEQAIVVLPETMKKKK